MIIWIPGEPVAKQRPRLGRHGAYTPKKTKDYEAHVAGYASQAMAGRPPHQSAVTVVMRVCSTDKADLDNIVKSVLDGMNGVVYVDDKQVSTIIAHRTVSTETFGVLVFVSEIIKCPHSNQSATDTETDKDTYTETDAATATDTDI